VLPRSWLESLTFIVPAVVILLVAVLELRRWLERRRRERQMAQALRGFLGRHTPETGVGPGPLEPPRAAVPETRPEQQP
jgi:hypothetical protein